MVENAFALWQHDSEFFRNDNVRLDRTEVTVLCCCVLHDFYSHHQSYAWELGEVHMDESNYLVQLQCKYTRNVGEVA